jgi:hypothetical protein
MLGLENVLKTDLSAYSIRVSYDTVGDSTQPADDDRAVALIRELVRGNISDIRQDARDVSTSISILQVFADATDAIGRRLGDMQSLAVKAASPDYSGVQVEQMQKEFVNLAQQINQTVESTEYDYNKLFTAEGESISIAVGDGSRADIFARDFSFDAQGLDLTTDPAAVLAEVKKATEELNEYRSYLGRQYGRLEDAMGGIELRYGRIMGIKPSDFDTSRARQTAENVVGMALQHASILLDIQANVIPDMAGRLLEYRPASSEQNTG